MSTSAIKNTSDPYLASATYIAHDKEYTAIEQEVDQMIHGHKKKSSSLLDGVPVPLELMENISSSLDIKRCEILGRLNDLKNNGTPHNELMKAASLIYQEIDQIPVDVVVNYKKFYANQIDTAVQLNTIFEKAISNLTPVPAFNAAERAGKFKEEKASLPSAIVSRVWGLSQYVKRREWQTPSSDLLMNQCHQEHINDSYTAEHHLDLANAVSSKKITIEGNKSSKEDLNASNQGYLIRTMEKNPGTVPPIFTSGKAGKEFAYRGPSTDPYDAQTRTAILKGNYLRCEGAVYMANPNPDTFRNTYKKSDAILTETTDSRKCAEFKTRYLEDITTEVARNGAWIDPNNPMLDTPIYNSSENGYEKKDTVGDMPPSEREAILKKEWVACSFISKEKTRSSGGDYINVGAIVTGTGDTNVCDDLHFANLRQMIQVWKEGAKH